MLSNAYFLAKFRFDTAENEPAKNLQKLKFCIKFAKFVNFPCPAQALIAAPGGARVMQGVRDKATFTSFGESLPLKRDAQKPA